VTGSQNVEISLKDNGGLDPETKGGLLGGWHHRLRETRGTFAEDHGGVALAGADKMRVKPAHERIGDYILARGQIHNSWPFAPNIASVVVEGLSAATGVTQS